MPQPRITHARADGRVAIRFRHDEYTHEALDLLGAGKTVFLVPTSAHRVAVYTERTHRLTRRVARPLCEATRAGAMPRTAPRRGQRRLAL